MNKEKADARKLIQSRISKLSQSDIENRSKQIASLLKKLLSSFLKVPQNLGCFYPLADEVNLLHFLEEEKFETSFVEFQELNKQMKMSFRKSSYTELESAILFGKEFKIPPKSAQVVVPDVVLVPGIGFDKLGHRLGRGKGYYDRYLSNKEIVKIGICFQEQFVEEVPVDEFDIAMDFVITNLKILKVNNRRER